MTCNADTYEPPHTCNNPSCLVFVSWRLQRTASQVLAYPGLQDRYPAECEDLAYWAGCLALRLEYGCDPSELVCDYKALIGQLSVLAPHGAVWGVCPDGTLGLHWSTLQ